MSATSNTPASSGHPSILVPVIVAAADGSSLSNPGPAGWAWYISDDAWAAGGWDHGTNNMGELMAVLDLLRSTAHVDEPLRILCDSQYVINSLTKWLPGWKRKGWRKGDGKPVLNVELMKDLDAALKGRDVTFEWVKGHAGHRMNEAADERARAAATAFQQGRQPDTGPGFPGSLLTECRQGAAGRAEFTVGQIEEHPDLFSAGAAEVPRDDAPRPVSGSAAPRQKAAVVRATRAALATPSQAPLHPDFVCQHGARESGSPPWESQGDAELLSADAVGVGAVLVRARLDDAPAALLWVELPGGWVLRFAAVR